VVAYLTCMGGGVIRDYFIGGERLPLTFIADPTLPICIGVMVILITLINSWRPEIGKNRILHRFVNLPEYFGFGIVAIYGALVSINAGMSMLWVPLCAAASIAGGGILRDIVINREPVNFRGKIFEEAAMAGACVLIVLLFIADRFEESPVPVYCAILAAIVFTIGLHATINRHEWRYPPWLGGPEKPV
jgi:NitT/TauT family transport system substrate-binding protein